MSRPSYKELYLKEKAKTKFSYNLLMNIVKMLEQVGLKTELAERFNNYSFSKNILLKVLNPSNNLYGCIELKKDLLEESE